MADDVLDPSQRAGLSRAKLGALVRAHLATTGGDESDAAGVDPATVDAVHHASFGGGAALLVDHAAWVLIDSPTVGLGSALAWAATRQARTVDVIVDGGARANGPTLAREATRFASPPTMWSVEARTLVPTVAAVWSEPEPATAPPADLVEELRGAGLDVIVEHGVVSGEVLGLEAARIVVDDDGAPRIQVGVGKNDREAFAMLHGDLPTPKALQSVIDTVLQHRRTGANPHPLNRLAAARWLRAHLITDPARLPGWSLAPVAGLTPRTGINDEQPAYAIGTDGKGRAVVLACAVGIDLDLVSEAADLRALHAPSARLVLALPARDVHQAVLGLAAALAEPAEVLPIEGEWRR